MTSPTAHSDVSVALVAKNLPANAGDVFLGREDPLEKDMATPVDIIRAFQGVQGGSSKLYCLKMT